MHLLEQAEALLCPLKKEQMATYASDLGPG